MYIWVKSGLGKKKKQFFQDIFLKSQIPGKPQY